MSIDSFAVLYVFYLEPAFKILLILLVGVTVLHLINLIFSGGKAFPLIDKIFNTMIKSILLFFVFGWKLFVGLMKVMQKTLTVLIDTVKDFFTSKI